LIDAYSGATIAEGSPPQPEPLDTSWQSDPLNSHDELTSAYRDSYNRHSMIGEGAGAYGVDLGESEPDEGAGNDYDGDVADFTSSREGDTAGSEFAKALPVAGDDLVTRTAGSDRGDGGAGKAI
jgi:hypothetical protein